MYINDAAPGDGNAEPKGEARTLTGRWQGTKDFRVAVARSQSARGRKEPPEARRVERMDADGLSGLSASFVADRVMSNE
jgi:hypothetical protein